LKRKTWIEEERGTVKIVAHKSNIADEKFVASVLETIKDCYDRVGALNVEIVDICLFDKASAMDAFLSEEKRSLGIATSDCEASFFATHDAWRGTPRIMVSCDRMSALPEMVRLGSIHHEVAHTILHGSLEYYSFSLPEPLLRLEREGAFSRQVTRDLLYLASVAVKDYEVTRRLYENGYVEDQVAFNRYLLEPDEETREAWTLARENEAIRLLVLASILKPICCAAPLLRDGRHGGEIAEFIAKSMNFLPKDLSRRLLGIMEEVLKFGENTHENVDLFVKKVIEELA